MTESPPPAVEVTAAEFAELFRSLSSWGRWGEGDQRGALNHLDASRVVAASRLVREGTAVTLSLPMNTKASGDNPEPAVHYMTTTGGNAAEGLEFAKDYIASHRK